MISDDNDDDDDDDDDDGDDDSDDDDSVALYMRGSNTACSTWPSSAQQRNEETTEP
jgi:hypothetical protein